MNKYHEIADLTMQALLSGEYQMADQFLHKMLYESGSEAAKEILSEQNMVLKILTEVLLCEKNRGRGRDSFKAFARSYDAFFDCYQKVKRMIRRIWFGLDSQHQSEINALLCEMPVSSDMLAVVAKYSVPKEWWGDLFGRLITLIRKEHQETAEDLSGYLEWMRQNGLLGTEKCIAPRKRYSAFSYRPLVWEENGMEPGDTEADPNKIAVIFCTNEEGYASECKCYLEYLELPEGMAGEVLTIREAPGMAAGYNFGMRRTNAKYKIYIHHDTMLIHPKIPEKLVNAFRENEKTGLIGVFGSTVLPESGRWYQAPYEDSVLSLYQDAILNFLYPKKEEKQELREAEGVDGAFLATSVDIPWREDLFDGWHFYDIAACREMKKAGFSAALYADPKPWILHESTLRKDPADLYGKYCEVFLTNYRSLKEQIDEALPD